MTPTGGRWPPAPARPRRRAPRLRRLPRPNAAGPRLPPACASQPRRRGVAGAVSPSRDGRNRAPKPHPSCAAARASAAADGPPAPARLPRALPSWPPAPGLPSEARFARPAPAGPAPASRRPPGNPQPRASVSCSRGNSEGRTGRLRRPAPAFPHPGAGPSTPDTPATRAAPRRPAEPEQNEIAPHRPVGDDGPQQHPLGLHGRRHATGHRVRPGGGRAAPAQRVIYQYHGRRMDGRQRQRHVPFGRRVRGHQVVPRAVPIAFREPAGFGNPNHHPSHPAGLAAGAG